ALAYAHEQGIIHRDVKPSNILIAAGGRPLVTDFGLAKVVDSDETITRSGVTVGTPAYMAPEQARGEMDALDGRTDVYALGATLYEMLTGRPPFRGETSMKTLLQVLDAPAPSPARLRPDLPAQAAHIALRCLKKEPAERYASARELAADIDAFLGGERFVTAGRARGARGRPRWSRVDFAAAAVLLLAAALAAFAWFGRAGGLGALGGGDDDGSLFGSDAAQPLDAAGWRAESGAAPASDTVGNAFTLAPPPGGAAAAWRVLAAPSTAGLADFSLRFTVTPVGDGGPLSPGFTIFLCGRDEGAAQETGYCFALGEEWNSRAEMRRDGDPALVFDSPDLAPGSGDYRFRVERRDDAVEMTVRRPDGRETRVAFHDDLPFPSRGRRAVGFRVLYAPARVSDVRLLALPTSAAPRGSRTAEELLRIGVERGEAGILDEAARALADLLEPPPREPETAARLRFLSALARDRLAAARGAPREDRAAEAEMEKAAAAPGFFGALASIRLARIAFAKVGASAPGPREEALLERCVSLLREAATKGAARDDEIRARLAALYRRLADDLFERARAARDRGQQGAARSFREWADRFLRVLPDVCWGAAGDRATLAHALARRAAIADENGDQPAAAASRRALCENYPDQRAPFLRALHAYRYELLAHHDSAALLACYQRFLVPDGGGGEWRAAAAGAAPFARHRYLRDPREEVAAPAARFLAEEAHLLRARGARPDLELAADIYHALSLLAREPSPAGAALAAAGGADFLRLAEVLARVQRGEPRDRGAPLFDLLAASGAGGDGDELATADLAAALVAGRDDLGAPRGPAAFPTALREYFSLAAAAPLRPADARRRFEQFLPVAETLRDDPLTYFFLRADPTWRAEGAGRSAARPGG
ncbi:MAG: serine/threonine protein kinase, partial [Planctomycetes bacterium]|nr:serine/threonine protein kinase [Planctomycetota bacterium]